MITKRAAIVFGAAASLLAIAPGLARSATPAPGDIPDNQVYIAYQAPSGYSVKVPEGWARAGSGTATTFTDKYNAIQVDTGKATKAPSIASATATEVAALRRSVKGFRLLGVSAVQRSAGTAILIAYRAVSSPNAVTGKVVATSVERYEFWRAGKLAILSLQGAVGADNVDPWKTVTNSFHWAR
jgi:hypothetical protein